MVYMIGSNLESDYGAATEDLEEMLDAEYENVNIVIQTGGTKYWYMDGISNKKVQRFHIEDGELAELDNLGKMSMSTPDALTDFVTFAAEEYPAEEYVLVLWDHGGGIPVGFGYDEVFPDDYLVDVEIGQALDDAGVHFGAIVFDACNMCTLEVALSIMDNADYMVAAESYVNGIGIYYTDWMRPVPNLNISYRITVRQLYLIIWIPWMKRGLSDPCPSSNCPRLMKYMMHMWII